MLLGKARGVYPNSERSKDVNIDRTNAGTGRAWLVYELSGLSEVFYNRLGDVSRLLLLKVAVYLYLFVVESCSFSS